MELATKDYGHKVAGAVAAAGANHVQVEGLSITTILGRLRWERVGLLKVDIEGYESTLFAGDCAWLLRVDSMCIECHEGFGEGELSQLARRFGFQAPKRLAGVWLLRR